MLLAASITPFDWNRMLLSADSPPLFLLEVAVRCVVTYLLVLGALRVTGRRGVRQLSIFELSIILALGSAAGDAMFYHDVAILHVMVVFVVVTALYRLFNYLTERYPYFSDWLEGAPVLLVENGEINMANFTKQNITQKDLFGELRQKQVEHLGQVRRVYIEATGNFSAFFYEDEDVRPGLPIYPEGLMHPPHQVDKAGQHACALCGHVQELPAGPAQCAVCQNPTWIATSDSKRIQ
jgi:uncharacterized membrane protein YcaP (DUF421 family)